MYVTYWCTRHVSRTYSFLPLNKGFKCFMSSVWFVFVAYWLVTSFPVAMLSVLLTVEPILSPKENITSECTCSPRSAEAWAAAWSAFGESKTKPAHDWKICQPVRVASEARYSQEQGSWGSRESSFVIVQSYIAPIKINYPFWGGVF